VRRSWYRSDPPAVSYLTINNANIALLALFNEEGTQNIIMRLINYSNTSEEETAITSELFKGTQAFYCNYLDEETGAPEIKNNSVTVKLKPNEIATIKIINK
jgi:alpha-mannosidase